MEAEMAKSLLNSFKGPQKGTQVWGSEFKGLFASNNDYLDKPYVEGGYVHTDDDIVEIWFKWEGFDFPDGKHHFHAYKKDVHNWMTAAAETKRYLLEISEDSSD